MRFLTFLSLLFQPSFVRLLHNLYQVTSTPVVFINENYEIKHANSKYLELTGYKLRELSGRSFTETIDTSDIDDTIAETRKIFNGGVTNGFRNKNICKDGSIIEFKWKAINSKGWLICWAELQ